MIHKFILNEAKDRGLYQDEHYSMFYTFPFEKYRQTKHRLFGVLNALNEIKLLAGSGIKATLQSNVEVLLLVLEGAIWYHDSIANHQLLKAGDIQIISTGNNLSYAFSNASQNQNARFLEIRVYSNEINTKPKYFKNSFNFGTFDNQFQVAVMPKVIRLLQYLPINQCVWLSIGNFTQGQKIHYPCQKEKNDIYVMVLSGSISINGNQLAANDGIGIWDAHHIDINIQEDAKIIILDLKPFF